MFSRPIRASPRSRRAIPVTRSASTGLRLWGMALLPCWPAPNGSNASPTSVRCRCRISVAIRSRVPPRMASMLSSSACRSRLTTWVAAGSGARPSASQTKRSTSALTLACVPTAPEILPTAIARRARASRSWSRVSSAYQPAALNPKVIGSAWIPWLRPTMAVDRCWIASRRTTSARRLSSPSTNCVASRRVTAVAVSSTSELVNPKCSQRPSGPSRSVTERRKAMTSCCDSRSISWARATSTSVAALRIRSQSSAGMTPAACSASAASSSIRSHSSSRRRSPKISRSSGSA